MVCYVLVICVIFFFMQKTAYEVRISDWSSDVCSSDLRRACEPRAAAMIDRVIAYQHGTFPRSEDVVAATRRLERGRVAQQAVDAKIGSASGRERVCQYV